MKEKNNQKIKKKLAKKLSSDRYEHTLSTTYTAMCLAMKHGYDVAKAEKAALLHDCAKAISDSKKLKLALKYEFKISPAELEKPDLLHSKLGAFIANKKYGITDKEILDAIECHTTGKVNMSALDKILYLADYIEPLRSNSNANIEQIRKLAFEDMDKALLLCLESTIKYLEETNSPIDTITKKTYAYYQEQQNNISEEK